jgi:hypothetical protein
MKRKIFTKATPRAAEGIRRAYAGTGAKVTAVIDPHTGQVTVSVDIPEYAGERAAA